MREYPQFEDLGLDPAADHTEDLRPNKSRVMTDEVVVNYDKLETRADRGAGTPLEIMLAHGFSVGPLDGKVPLTRHGVQDFTRDRDVIARWTRQYPGCNWGCTQAGIVQLDIDPEMVAALLTSNCGRSTRL